MQSKWKIATIGDLVTLQRGFDLPSQEREAGPIPVMGSAGISGYHDKASTKGPGVVIGRSGVGSMGVTSFIDRDFWALNTTLFVTDFKGNDVGFIYYLLKSIDFRHLDSGSAQASLNRNVVYPVKVPVPATVDEQRSISRLLSGIDQRIALLRRSNATIESILQALFKSWFIDFDPIRAKAEGLAPEGMDSTTADLFPAEFEDSPLGLIPKGWRVSSLSEHVIAERGLSYKGSGLCEPGEGIPMHNLNSVLEGGGYKYSGIKHYSGDYKDRHVAVAGDVIVANTEQGHEHRLIGFPAIVPARYAKAIYSHHIYRARPKTGSPLRTHTLYYTLMAPSVREQVIGCANGSTVNMLKVAGLEIPMFVCPPGKVAEAFEAIASPLRRQMESNVERADNLAALRDALLPRLIAGKLRLPELREEIREAIA